MKSFQLNVFIKKGVSENTPIQDQLTRREYEFKPAKHLVLTSAYLHLPSPAKSEDKGLVTLQEGPLNPGRQKHSPGIRHEPWHSAEHMATKQIVTTEKKEQQQLQLTSVTIGASPTTIADIAKSSTPLLRAITATRDGTGTTST